MSDLFKRTISLREEQEAYIDGLITCGSFASASEVIRAGLRALQERDAVVERWLQNEVAPVYDKMKADPGRGHEAESVFNKLRDHHAQKLTEES